MGVARDVFEILDTAFVDFSDTMKDRFDDINSIQASSISRKAADGTLQFPVLMSRSINFENAQRVTKAIESKCASFAEIVMTMNPTMDTYGHNGASEYVRQFHSNIDTEDDPFDAVSNFVNSKESYDIQTQVYTAGSYDYRALKEDLKEFGCDWRENKLNDVVEAKYVKDNQFVVPLRGSQLQELVKEKLKAVREARGSYNYDTRQWDDGQGQQADNPGAPGNGMGDRQWQEAEAIKRAEADMARQTSANNAAMQRTIATNRFNRNENRKNRENAIALKQMEIDARNASEKRKEELEMDKIASNQEFQREMDAVDKEFQEWMQNHRDATQAERDKAERKFRAKQSRIERGFRRKEAEKERKFREKMAARPDRVAFQDILMNNEVKKSNELQPILLHIRVIAKEEKMYTDFVIGVKATMHPINSEEMVNELVEACRFHSEVFRFIRWTTGEISFLTDFLLNMKDSKRAISRQSNGGSPWWNRLHKMSVIAKFKKATFMKKRILPNATIVCSQQEVDYIKSTYGFDLMKPNFIEDIMSKYFLLCFAVLDDSLEVVHFKFDGQRSYETLSFSGLEKENSNAARNFRDILKAVQHV